MLFRSHPFETKFGALAHNGIWFEWESAFWGLLAQGRMPVGSPSDSWVMAQLVDINGPDVLTFVDSGVWLLLRPDSTCLAVVQSGDLEIARIRGSIVAASKIPAWLKPKAEKKGYVWRVKSGSVVELNKDGYEVVYGAVVHVPAVKNFATSKIVYGFHTKTDMVETGYDAPPVYGECEFCKMINYLTEDDGYLLCPTCIKTLNGEFGYPT